MRELASRYADGSLKGILKAYVRLHIMHCRQCRQAIDVLRNMRDRLRRLTETPTPGLSEDRWSAIRDSATHETETAEP